MTLFVMYLAIVSTISASEVVIGALAATGGAAAAVATRRALLSADNPERYRPRFAWLRWLRHVPGQIVTDSARLLRPRGQVATVRMPADDRAAARRGFSALVLSISPGDYVIKVDPDENTLTIHRAVRRDSALEREVTR
jgi:multisubunit Na+/H+ antiporter MnhE subunit